MSRLALLRHLDPCEYGPLEDVAGHHLVEGGGGRELLHAHGGREDGGRGQNGANGGEEKYHSDYGLLHYSSRVKYSTNPLSCPSGY